MLERLCEPPYRPGDILYVRETWYYESHMEDMSAGEPDLPSGAYSRRYIFKADCPDYPVNVGVGQHGWRPSIHMPREAARIFLRVTDVRVERLQDCGEGWCIDIEREGITTPQDPILYISDDDFHDALREAFKKVWDSTIKPADRDRSGWEANPWVWVITFERCEKPKGANHD